VVDIKIGLGGKMCVRVHFISRRLPPTHTTPLSRGLVVLCRLYRLDNYSSGYNREPFLR